MIVVVIAAATYLRYQTLLSRFPFLHTARTVWLSRNPDVLRGLNNVWIVWDKDWDECLFQDQKASITMFIDIIRKIGTVVETWL